MKHLYYLLLSIVSIIAPINAHSQSSIEIRGMQNRIVEISDHRDLFYATCEALMDKRIISICTSPFIGRTTTQANDIRALLGSMHSLPLYKILIHHPIGSGWQHGEINIFGTNKDNVYRINVSVSMLGQSGATQTKDPSFYKDFFDSIGESLFINKLNITLGEFSE
jgi:hypothetical protein